MVDPTLELTDLVLEVERRIGEGFLSLHALFYKRIPSCWAEPDSLFTIWKGGYATVYQAELLDSVFLEKQDHDGSPLTTFALKVWCFFVSLLWQQNEFLTWR